MPYTVDATNAASPLDSDDAQYAAAEFRALKTHINTNLRPKTYIDAQDAAMLAAAAADATTKANAAQTAAAADATTKANAAVTTSEAYTDTVFAGSGNMPVPVNGTDDNKILEALGGLARWVVNKAVQFTAATGSAKIPAGTTAQRDASPIFGYFRANNDLNLVEWFSKSGWTSVGAGAKGGGRDKVFHENSGFVTENYTIGENEYISGVTVTVANPAVFTLANHGFVKDMPVHLRTTGNLLTGLAVDTVYYVIAAGLTVDDFQLSATVGGAAIATSGTQSGVHSVGQIIHAVVAHGFSVADGKGVTVENGSSIAIAG